MIKSPNTRAVQTGDSVTKRSGVGASSVAQAYAALRLVQAHQSRPAATVADILGRDPKREDVFVGGTRLIERPAK